ncbi:hypothetical protein R1flu_012504 [Riccia fluitans]|uniref:Uncharacterized protein n=1 Tax=Riccia fluitans TaxID=41844 RepID=A0ABD1ZE57_9MARC
MPPIGNQPGTSSNLFEDSTNPDRLVVSRRRRRRTALERRDELSLNGSLEVLPSGSSKQSRIGGGASIETHSSEILGPLRRTISGLELEVSSQPLREVVNILPSITQSSSRHVQEVVDISACVKRVTRSCTNLSPAGALHSPSGESRNRWASPRGSRLGEIDKENEVVGISREQTHSVGSLESNRAPAPSLQASNSPPSLLDDEQFVLAINETDLANIPTFSALLREVSGGTLAHSSHAHRGNVSVRGREKLATGSVTSPASGENCRGACQDNNVSVTPRSQPSSRLATGVLRTPEQLVPALGEGISPRNGLAGTEGKLLVYDRRTSKRDGGGRRQTKSCPQPQKRCKTSLSTGRRGRSEGGFSRRSKDSLARNKGSKMLLPEGYRREIAAYFAEVDAFELQEEEEADEDEKDEPKVQDEKSPPASGL